ncbi:hypothetical protein [Ornithinimicrobium panacihumi]|uniref:hypothetical protein n=1 Tax=Ornithinimicrobium panacihumi TaxID=2008449 RepID=UPI003F8A0E47
MTRPITIRQLELRVRDGAVPWEEDTPYPTVDLVLDGRDLRDWVRTVLPAGAEDVPYLGHPVDADLRSLLLGRWSGDGPSDGSGFGEDFDGRVALLGCTCTVIGCGPLVARITVDEDAGTVTWSDFSRYRGPHVDYDPLELRFELGAYERAIEDFLSR